MKTKDFVELVRSGNKPVVIFTEDIEELESADPGMMARVTGVGITEDWGEGSKTIEVIVNFEEFEQHNRTVARPIWSDDDGQFNKIWMDTGWYPKSKTETYYLMLTEKGEDGDVSYFEVKEGNGWFDKYLRVKEQYTSYVDYLEQQLSKKSITEKRQRKLK